VRMLLVAKVLEKTAQIAVGLPETSALPYV
jgi:hypothetical protein